MAVVAWMMVIFSASSDTRSMQHSSRIFGPIIHWLFPRMDEPGVERLIFALRKCAHVTEYAILAVLVWIALPRAKGSQQPRWDWRVARLALVISALYAATDELHQLFVPTRQGSVWDVLLDTCGAALGLFMIWLLRMCRKEVSD
jgi:VanZ family protein